MLSIIRKVNYNIKDVLKVITDVESYPDFVPWCKKIDIVYKDSNHVIADVKAIVGFTKVAYRCEITIDDYTNNRDRNRYASVVAKASEGGPFIEMEASWILTSLDNDITEVNFSFRFKLKNRIKQIMSKFFINKITEMTITSFISYIDKKITHQDNQEKKELSIITG